MEDAKRGTPREWNHYLFTLNLSLSLSLFLTLPLSLLLSLSPSHTHYLVSNNTDHFRRKVSYWFYTWMCVCVQLTDQCGCMQMASLTSSTRVTPEHWCKRNAFSPTHTLLLEVRAHNSKFLYQVKMVTVIKHSQYEQTVRCDISADWFSVLVSPSFLNWLCSYFCIFN